MSLRGGGSMGLWVTLIQPLYEYVLYGISPLHVAGSLLVIVIIYGVSPLHIAGNHHVIVIIYGINPLHVQSSIM